MATNRFSIDDLSVLYKKQRTSTVPWRNALKDLVNRREIV
jgi:hypothetical protein